MMASMTVKVDSRNATGIMQCQRMGRQFKSNHLILPLFHPRPFIRTMLPSSDFGILLSCSSDSVKVTTINWLIVVPFA